MNRAPTHAFSRRTLLGRSAGVAAAVVGASAMTVIATKAAIGVGTSASQAGPTGTLSIPPLLSPDVVDGVSVYTLELETGTHQVLSGVSSSTCGFNGLFLGPTMQWTDSEAVRLDITNRLGADSTVHFHGAHVPAKDDGGPQLAFADGQTWSPSFTVNQQAAVEHSFHLHEVPFQIISVNGKAPTGAALGWKDIVDVPVNAVVKIAMEFTDYADSTYMYMPHCHIAPHEDEGMMLGVMVES